MLAVGASFAEAVVVAMSNDEQAANEAFKRLP
jgi:hypothetical protein